MHFSSNFQVEPVIPIFFNFFSEPLLPSQGAIAMEIRWWWHSVLVLVLGGSVLKQVTSDPQINLLVERCSLYNATNVEHFFMDLNITFADLRDQLSKSKKLFATAQQARSADPVYAMVQCRDYLSSADCVACYDVAVTRIRRCLTANGARVIYDGCFLRYESDHFYNEMNRAGNSQICSNNANAHLGAEFQTEAQALLYDLQFATPRINGFFAASTRPFNSGKVYGLAQCVETITMVGCKACLAAAHENIGSCLPDTDGRAFDAGCFMRYSVTPFFADDQITNIKPFLGKGGSGRKKDIIIGLIGGGGFLMIVLALILWTRPQRNPKAGQKGNILGATELQGPVTYRYKDLKSATKDFSEENKLGQGGFGEVYKGKLPNGDMVSVKKLNLSRAGAKEGFDGEIRLISNVHHRNLVRLLGCARNGEQLLLVHEYMENGSLDRYLYGDKRGTLSWGQRFNIILGTARGLAYLHEQFHVSIIHRDIKPSNILLDDEFQPKIADFGLAKLLPVDQSHLSTKFAGTFGYTSPEYVLQGRLSAKVDAYSLGVVMLEIISGKRSNDVEVERIHDYLVEQAWKLYENDMHIELVDETLDPNEYNAEEVKKIIKIALMCTQSEPTSRPTMSEVIVMLTSDPSMEQRSLERSYLMDPERKFISLTSMSTEIGPSTSHATASLSDVSGR